MKWKEVDYTDIKVLMPMQVGYYFISTTLTKYEEIQDILSLI